MWLMAIVAAVAFVYFVIAERKTEYPCGGTWGWRTSIVANATAFSFMGAMLAALWFVSELIA